MRQSYHTNFIGRPAKYRLQPGCHDPEKAVYRHFCGQIAPKQPNNAANSIAELKNGFCDITQLLNLYDKLLSRHPVVLAAGIRRS